MTEFFQNTWSVTLELAPWLILGAFVAGLLHVLLPKGLLHRQLKGRGGVLKAVALGVPLPLCSCGVIPVGLGLKKGGASDGAAVGFLISTPQTGVDSALVSASFFGWPFALFKVASAAVLGLAGGWLADAASGDQADAAEVDLSEPRRGGRLGEFVEHSVMLLRSIWRWIVFGVLASAAITTLVPQDAFAALSGYGGLTGMLLMLLVATPLYVCATASVPIAAALVAAGLPTGAALVFLMAGPATNIATIGAIYRTLGTRSLAIYLGTILVGSIGAGLLFEQLIDASALTESHLHIHQTWWAVASAVVLLTLFAWFLIDDVMKRLAFRRTAAADPSPALEVGVEGMTCGGCVSKLESTLRRAAGVRAAEVTLRPGRARVQGEVSPDRIRELVTEAGFRPV